MQKIPSAHRILISPFLFIITISIVISIFWKFHRQKPMIMGLNCDNRENMPKFQRQDPTSKIYVKHIYQIWSNHYGQITSLTVVVVVINLKKNLRKVALPSAYKYVQKRAKYPEKKKQNKNKNTALWIVEMKSPLDANTIYVRKLVSRKQYLCTTHLFLGEREPVNTRQWRSFPKQFIKKVSRTWFIFGFSP